MGRRPLPCALYFCLYFYSLIKAIRMAEWIFPETPQEAAAESVGSLNTPVHVVLPHPCKIYLVGMLVIQLFQKHRLHSQHM